MQALQRGTSPLVVRVVGAEQLLGEPEHQLVVGLRQPEDRQDHLQRVLHGDVDGEVARSVELRHACDRAVGELGEAGLELGQVLGEEPLGGEVAVPAVLGTVHLHERLDEVTLLLAHRVRDLVAEHRSRLVQEHRRLHLDRQHVGVLGDGPERVEVLDLDPVDRILTAQQRGSLVPAALVGVPRGRRRRSSPPPRDPSQLARSSVLPVLGRRPRPGVARPDHVPRFHNAMGYGAPSFGSRRRRRDVGDDRQPADLAGDVHQLGPQRVAVDDHDATPAGRSASRTAAGSSMEHAAHPSRSATSSTPAPPPSSTYRVGRLEVREAQRQVGDRRAERLDPDAQRATGVRSRLRDERLRPAAGVEARADRGDVAAAVQVGGAERGRPAQHHVAADAPGRRRRAGAPASADRWRTAEPMHRSPRRRARARRRVGRRR